VVLTIIVALLIGALLIASPASGSTIHTYCGQVYTQPQSKCWWSTQIGGAHSWKYNAPYYEGSGSFVVCAEIAHYPRNYDNVYHISCQFVDNSGLADAIVTWCGSGKDEVNKDAGVGNGDNNRHTLQGVASHDYC